MSAILDLVKHGDAVLLATQLNEMKKVIHTMDVDFILEAAKDFIDKASWQESAAVLNPRYNPEKPDTLRVMGETLHHLHNFIIGLKKCDEMKAKVADYEAKQNDIAKLFM